MTEDKKAQLNQFLKDNQVLVVDKSPSSRKSLIQAIVDLGAERKKVHVALTYEDAIKTYNEQRPMIIISDYYISGGSGFQLFQEIRKGYPEGRDIVLSLVTSNANQTTVAKAAEEDVDCYVLKPYTLETLQTIFANAILEKNFPSEYMQLIYKGKDQLFDGNFEDSIPFFDQAIALNKTPSLALFYKGQAEYCIKKIDEAEKDFQTGLSFNKIHFKCLLGLYNLYKDKNKREDAYKIAKSLTTYFPANDERLCEVVRLCVETENFEDMEDYYNVFKELEERSKELSNYISAGLYVGGRYQASQGEIDNAVKYFVWLTAASQRSPRHLRAIIKVLCKHDDYEEAKRFLKKFDVEDLKSDEYKIASYTAEFNDLDTNTKIKDGIDIFRSKGRDPDCFQMLLNSMAGQDMDQRMNKLLEEAKEYWPDKQFKIPVIEEESEESEDDQQASNS